MGETITMNTDNRPLPKPDEDSEEFWRYCNEHQLRMQRCQDCGTIRFRPSVICPKCLSSDFTWQLLSGSGQIHSFVIVHQAMVPGYSEVPYVLALVELDEGPRMTTRIVNCDTSEVSIGSRVQVCFEDATDTVSLPVFTLAKTNS